MRDENLTEAVLYVKAAKASRFKSRVRKATSRERSMSSAKNSDSSIIAYGLSSYLSGSIAFVAPTNGSALRG